ncbi:sulfur carrier protein ThiS [Mesobacillus harenae]|uniref:sulfur carrier protein ThiS n=1 Tax=Mesobacillus harenae TaxID=2213203 RepID=UPI00157FC9EC|nr:sulfur carrier protein ThiS [Mesobacillus harenae]
MTIKLNGRSVKLPTGVNTVKDLLDHYNLENRIVIVELNKQITEKNQYTSLFLSDGDMVEMIHFVGGG